MFVIKEVRLMKYTILGAVLLTAACASLIDIIPTPNRLMVCAGVNQVYYDRLFGKSMQEHKEVEVYIEEARAWQPEGEPLNQLYFFEGAYQAKVLNPDQLVARVTKCKNLL